MSADPQKEVHVQVWDAPVRLFHWAIVILMLVSWLSADQGYMRVHLWSGLTLLALLIFRLVWGLIGSTTARFRDFLHPPRKVLAYLRGLAGANKALFAGHNPAGGLMVVGLIAVLLLQAVTGLFSNDGLRFHGPLALLVSEETSTGITGLHGMIFNVILVLVWLHVVAVGFYLFVKGDNLIFPMLTGKKKRAHVPEGWSIKLAHPLMALLVLMAAAGLVFWLTV
ncbi:MAG: cytochrome b/b6 domain-containing protein [Pseudomonadota bacterium]